MVKFLKEKEDKQAKREKELSFPSLALLISDESVMAQDQG